MNLFKYIYYKAHQLNLKNNNFGYGISGSLLAGTFTITISIVLISIGIMEYLNVIFKINLFQGYNRRSLTSKFYNLSPYLAIGVLYFIVCAWLTSAVFLMSVVNSK